MKLKSTLLVISALVVSAVSSSAATMIVSNVAAGPGDTLYAYNNNSLMNGGLVTMGYFSADVTTNDINTIAGLVAQIQLGKYTLVTSAAPGSESAQLGASFPGYADQANSTSIGSITGANALIGRAVFSIVTDAASLLAATPLNQFALLQVGTILDDVPLEQNYGSNPTGFTPIIGTLGTFNGDAGAGDGEYGTLQMAVIPEPSAALLGALGALGLLRRRRI